MVGYIDLEQHMKSSKIEVDIVSDAGNLIIILLVMITNMMIILLLVLLLLLLITNKYNNNSALIIKIIIQIKMKSGSCIKMKKD